MTRQVISRRRAMLMFLAYSLKHRKSLSNFNWRKGFAQFGQLWHEKFVLHEGKIIINTALPPWPSKAFENGVYNNGFGNPISVNLALTGECSYSCSNCSYGEQKKDVKYLTTEQWINAVSQLQDSNVPIIGFTGGEPLLRKDLEEIISTVDDRSCTILHTSGKSLTRERARKLKESGLDYISISLDHHDREINDMIRGKGSYDAALKAIKYSKEAGLYTVTSMNITERTIDDFPRYLEFVNDLGVHGVRVLDVVPSGNCIDKPPLSAKSRQKLIRYHKKYNRDKRLPQLTTVCYLESPEMFGCGPGITHGYIDPEGNVGGCDFSPFRVGNITKESYEVIYQRIKELFPTPERECLMKAHREEFERVLNGRRFIPYDEVKPLIERLRTGSLPDAYK